MEDDLVLSAESLAALASFRQDQRQQQEVEAAPTQAKLESGVLPFEEDWNLSQFWYSEQTTKLLAVEALAEAGPTGVIACVASPSAFARLRPVCHRRPPGSLRVLEFDRRFEVYGADQFVFYDYNRPTALPEELHHACAFLIVDPPFLSEECLARTLETVVWLLAPGGHVVLNTGGKMEPFLAVQTILPLALSPWRPLHARRLSNPFRCWANYTSQRLLRAAGEQEGQEEEKEGE